MKTNQKHIASIGLLMLAFVSLSAQVKIDDIRIYNRALTSSEVLYLSKQ